MNFMEIFFVKRDCMLSTRCMIHGTNGVLPFLAFQKNPMVNTISITISPSVLTTTTKKKQKTFQIQCFHNSRLNQMIQTKYTKKCHAVSFLLILMKRLFLTCQFVLWIGLSQSFHQSTVHFLFLPVQHVLTKHFTAVIMTVVY